MTATQLIQNYALSIRQILRASPYAPEPALAPSFQQLLGDLLDLQAFDHGLTVVPEFRNPGIGRPDIALVRAGAPARAFVELKAPAKSANPVKWRDHDQRQYERFREFACWATCNFSEIRLFYREEMQAMADILPRNCLAADCSDAKADRLIANHDQAPVIALLDRLRLAAGQEPVARDAEHLANMMAHSARLVRGIVRDRLADLPDAENANHPLIQVKQEFRDVLYAHPEAGGYTATDFSTLFSAAFAQTLAFGLLLVREATGTNVTADAWNHMPPEHPLMRTALRVLSLPEVMQEIGTGFDVMLDTINSFSPEILALRTDGSDPILKFYEYFLATFDPAARERYGVYYTPIEVVRFMAGALDRALRSLETDGLADPAVTILDPATGTGTFLLGIAERVRDQVAGTAGRGMAALALQNLAHRMFAFELLVGPYAVAHYRLHHALSRQTDERGERVAALALPRLGIYLADTLAEPGAAAAIGRLGFVSEGIADERREANRIKSEQPILAIIGNPPYRRLEEGENRTLVGQWMDGLWADLKEPVSAAGKGNQLNTFPELSVAFWRWAIWKMFESDNAPRRGVVAYITNRKFLTGWPYAGLRQMMRQRFDRIEITDLRGDIRSGERAGIEGDQGVFNIQVGTAITIAIADGSKPQGTAAQVHYLDSWAADKISRRAKLNWLEGGKDEGGLPGLVPVARGWLEDMRPKPFMNGELASLADCFNFYKSGMKSGNDELFVATRREALRTKIAPTLADLVDFRYNDDVEKKLAYRPLDSRWFYNELSILNRPGPQMQKVWGDNNVCLYAMPGGTGAGPAAWCHGQLPDYHSFRGSYGGYAFPLHDRHPAVNASNMSEALIASLEIAYNAVVTAEDVFDAILCLLSASTYTSRFAEDLEDVFPHVPFPADQAVFAAAAALGREIRAVETFTRPPATRVMVPDFVQIATVPTGMASSVNYTDSSIVLCNDGSGLITGLPAQVWNFSVSGYRVLPRWLEARVGMQADLQFAGELRDICGRIAELVDLFAQADTVLESTLRGALTREALGLQQPEPDNNVGQE